MSRPSLLELENHSDFIQRHIGPTAEQQLEMARAMGYDSVDALIDDTVTVNSETTIRGTRWEYFMNLLLSRDNSINCFIALECKSRASATPSSSRRATLPESIKTWGEVHHCRQSGHRRLEDSGRNLLPGWRIDDGRYVW